MSYQKNGSVPETQKKPSIENFNGKKEQKMTYLDTQESLFITHFILDLYVNKTFGNI